MLKKPGTHPYASSVAALIAGSALPFAFAPFAYYIIAILAPALLLLTWLNATAKQAFYRGLLFGCAFFAVGVSWIFISIHVFGNSNIVVAAFLTSLMIVLMALFPAVNGYLLTRFWPKNSLVKLLLAFPASWVLLEWLRGSWAYFLGGFPWVLLGFSQTNSPLRGLAPIIGVYGLSFICVFISALIVLALMRWQQQKIKQSLACLLFIILFSVFVYPLDAIKWTEQQDKPIDVSLIQGNIPQSLKWSEQAFQHSLDIYQQLTEQHWQSKLIIWPEGAIAMPSAYMQNYLSTLSQQARKHHTTLITGIPAEADSPDHYYNAMIALGDGSGSYYKRQLVPFGEYVPMENWLRGIFNVFNLPMSSIVPGPKQQANLYSNSLHLQIAPFICYEIAYPNIVLADLPDAELLVTISDDAWFGDSLAPAQHLQIAQMRSLQTGRYQVTVTNNGITAIINPQGQIIAHLPQFKRGVLTGTVFAMTGATPWVRMGYMPILLFIFALLLLAFLLRKRNLNVIRVKNFGFEAGE